MAFEKVHMHRCASSFVTATYEKVGLIPHDSRALPLKLFETPYYKYVDSGMIKIMHKKYASLRRPCAPRI
jgi:glycogen debranching enzyme